MWAEVAATSKKQRYMSVSDSFAEHSCLSLRSVCMWNTNVAILLHSTKPTPTFFRPKYENPPQKVHFEVTP